MTYVYVHLHVYLCQVSIPRIHICKDVCTGMVIPAVPLPVASGRWRLAGEGLGFLVYRICINKRLIIDPWPDIGSQGPQDPPEHVGLQSSRHHHHHHHQINNDDKHMLLSIT